MISNRIIKRLGKTTRMAFNDFSLYQYNICNFPGFDIFTFEIISLSSACLNFFPSLFSPVFSFMGFMLVLSERYLSFWKIIHQHQPESPLTCQSTETSLCSFLSPQQVWCNISHSWYRVHGWVICPKKKKGIVHVTQDVVLLSMWVVTSIGH